MPGVKVAAPKAGAAQQKTMLVLGPKTPPEYIFAFYYDGTIEGAKRFWGDISEKCGPYGIFSYFKMDISDSTLSFSDDNSGGDYEVSPNCWFVVEFEGEDSDEIREAGVYHSVEAIRRDYTILDEEDVPQ